MIREAFRTKAFIPFIMAGHPNLALTEQAILRLAAQGADIIELGVPFSDPVADGPVNQKAAEIALSQGVCLSDIFALVSRVRSSGCTVPILLFSYLNPILALGYERFITDAKAAGIEGVLVVDLPPEEGQDFYVQLQAAGLEFVLLASPTTDPNRYALYRDLNPCFVYYISRLAVTGVQNALSEHLESEVKALRGQLPDSHIAVGFGISTPEQAKQVAHIADGVIVGSLLVKTLETEGLAAFEQVAGQMAAFKQ
jgi:tryptophan synthase alpha chain